jgi:hypothetical protein
MSAGEAGAYKDDAEAEQRQHRVLADALYAISDHMRVRSRSWQDRIEVSIPILRPPGSSSTSLFT